MYMYMADALSTTYMYVCLFSMQFKGFDVDEMAACTLLFEGSAAVDACTHTHTNTHTHTHTHKHTHTHTSVYTSNRHKYNYIVNGVYITPQEVGIQERKVYDIASKFGYI